MTKKKPEPNPIETAIGDRAKDPKAHEKFTKEYQTEPIPQDPSEIPGEPSPQEVLTLEELNRRTEERLQEEPSPEVKTAILETQIPYVPPKKEIPVSKPAPQPVTETSSLGSPPQKIEEIDEYSDAEKSPTLAGIAESLGRKMNEAQKGVAPTVSGINKMIKENPEMFSPTPAEDVELTALKKYVLEDGFVLATVAFHIVSLCAEPLTTPSTTTWDFADRASIPDMVLALLNQPGYLEGIWPSLKIVMGTNVGNSAWTAGIATTIAFFDVIRTLPAIVELKNETKS